MDLKGSISLTTLGKRYTHQLGQSRILFVGQKKTIIEMLNKYN